MTYRDDDEAARARADALQRDLDDTQDELAEARAQLAAAEAEKARLAEEVAEVRARLPERAPAPAPRAAHAQPEQARTSGVELFALAAIGIVFVLIAIGVSRSRSASQDQDPPNPTCTLRTEPPGASIYGVCKNTAMSEPWNEGLPEVLHTPAVTTFEMHRGTTPLAQARQAWIIDDILCGGSMVARLPGYADTPVSSPLVGMGCDETVVRLRSTAE